MDLFRLAVGLGVPGFALAIFFVLFRKFPWDLNKKGPRQVAVLLIVLVTGITWYALYRYAPKDQEPYRLLIMVLGTDSQPLADAEVRADVAEQIRKLDNAWELVIRDRTQGDEVNVYATSGFAKGESTVKLERERDIRVQIRLEKQSDGLLTGRVVDSGGHPVADARVSVLGHEPESVLTDTQGHFRLQAFAAPGEEVHVSAQAAQGNWGGYVRVGTAIEIRLIPKQSE